MASIILTTSIVNNIGVEKASNQEALSRGPQSTIPDWVRFKRGIEKPYNETAKRLSKIERV